MNINEIKAGTKVMHEGTKGTVREVCSWDTGMIVVEKSRGTTCVPKSNFSGKFEGNYIIEL